MEGIARRQPPRVILVLGAGGPVGSAFHAGALAALHAVSAWDPRTAPWIVGTSAGAQVGAWLRAGATAADLKARLLGAPLSAAGLQLLGNAVRPEERFSPPQSPPRWPASRQYLASPRLRPLPWATGRLLAALLPEGRRSPARMAADFQRAFGSRWPERPLWVTALQLDSGQRVVFGHPNAPKADVPTAVMSSSAVPGYSQPVRLGAHRYVDAGVLSATHVDLLDAPPLASLEPELIVVSSPLSRFRPLRATLRWQLKRLQARRDTPFLLLEPSAHVNRAMGRNPMDPTRAARVAAVTYYDLRHRLQHSQLLSPLDAAS